MAWADVPAKLALWATKDYYMTDGIARLIADYARYDGQPLRQREDPENVALDKRAEFEARLDYYLGADDNLAASVAWTPDMLRRV